MQLNLVFWYKIYSYRLKHTHANWLVIYHSEKPVFILFDRILLYTINSACHIWSDLQPQYIFFSGLVWRMQFIFISGKIIMLCEEKFFILKCLLIEFVKFIFVYQKSLKRKSRFEFIFSCCEFTKVILQ